jgi:hypothetical protein
MWLKLKFGLFVAKASFGSLEKVLYFSHVGKFYQAIREKTDL